MNECVCWVCCCSVSSPHVHSKLPAGSVGLGGEPPVVMCSCHTGALLAEELTLVLGKERSRRVGGSSRVTVGQGTGKALMSGAIGLCLRGVFTVKPRQCCIAHQVP